MMFFHVLNNFLNVFQLILRGCSFILYLSKSSGVTFDQYFPIVCFHVKLVFLHFEKKACFKVVFPKFTELSLLVFYVIVQNMET